MRNKYLRPKLAVRKAQKAKKAKEEKMIKNTWQTFQNVLYYKCSKDTTNY